ncbi:hypothetical protein MKZ38_002638 [Zalerion maritima]|uniref:Ig-like domain-containing protein n=1 Tax=Zalerion maritima TaxID=339359 RepID=A0AAD5WXS5_9PEZI|nr:hypothetical protein MKZ38_002638 [Zalerion maritima]
MDTIKNAIWGSGKNPEEQKTPTQQQELVSGETGDVSQGEPYDAGNMTPQVEKDSNTTEETTQQHKEGADHPTYGMHSEPPSTSAGLQGNKETSTAEQTKPKPAIGNEEEPTCEVTGSGPRPIGEVAWENGGHMPENKTAMTRGVSMNTAKSASSSSSSSSSSSDEKVDESKANPAAVGETECLTSHEHASSATEIAKGTKPTTNEDNATRERATSGSTRESQKEDENFGMNQDGKHPHTDHYISTGMVNKGGNFDVTKPGAGKEAQRLIHQGALQHSQDEETNGAKKHHAKVVPHLPLHKKGSNGSKDQVDANSNGVSSHHHQQQQQQQKQTSPSPPPGTMTKQESAGQGSNTSSKGSDGSKTKLSEKLKNKLHIGSH